MNPPRFTHDCDACLYLGPFEASDLYYCARSDGGTVIARYGSEGPQYASRPIFLLTEAHRAHMAARDALPTERAFLEAYARSPLANPITVAVLAAMAPADEIEGPEVDEYIAVMECIAGVAKQRADVARANRPSADTDKALRAIKILEAVGVPASWEFPGYISIAIDDDGTEIAYGCEDTWGGHVQTLDGFASGEAEELPRDATPEQIAAVLVNCYAAHTTGGPR